RMRDRGAVARHSGPRRAVAAARRTRTDPESERARDRPAARGRLAADGPARDSHGRRATRARGARQVAHGDAHAFSMGVPARLSRDGAPPRSSRGARVLCTGARRARRRRMTRRTATPLRVQRIVWREIRLALKEPFRISSGVVDNRRIALLELTDRDGATSWSECVAFERPNYSPET